MSIDVYIDYLSVYRCLQMSINIYIDYLYVYRCLQMLYISIYVYIDSYIIYIELGIVYIEILVFPDDLIISILHTRAAFTLRNHPTTSTGGNNTNTNNELLLRKNQIYWFIKKHSDHVKVYLSSPLDSKRGRAVNLNTNAAWFELLGESIQKHSINEDCLYGCDETGFQIGMSQWQYVIGGAGKKQQHCQQESDSCETITAVVTICTDGSSIPPLVIFKGKAFSVKWGDDNPLKASYMSF